LVVEDDPEVCGLLELLLREEGHHVATALDGAAALEWMARGTVRPDLIVADYNLPNGMNGIEVAAKLRERGHREIPVIILTADISIAALRSISGYDCVQLNKPVKAAELRRAVDNLLPGSPPAVPEPHPAAAAGAVMSPVIFIVDDDSDVRGAFRSVLEEEGLVVEDYETGEAFLKAYRPGKEACLLIDAYLPGMSGLGLLQRLHDTGDRLPSIMITGNSDVTIAVQAMKAGASDFIEKPVSRRELIASIERALEQSRDSGVLVARRQSARNIVAGLTPRQQEIMERVLAGHPSKNIAADLGISQRTVENHRAAIMTRTGVASLPALARLAVAATWNGADPSPAHREPSAKAAR
jgi:two-component system CheB/CheR fusion protein